MSGSNLRSIEGLLPEQYDRTYIGTVVSSGGALAVSVQGNTIPARWSDPVTASVGDTVLVQLVVTRTGGTEAVVRDKVTSKPRPGRGTVTVVPPSSDTVTVTGSDGATYTAYFVTSYTPTVNDTVILSWGGTSPTIIGKAAAIPAPYLAPSAQPIAPPPAPPQSGQAIYAASDSATWWPSGGWNAWAGGNGRVYQGQYGSGQVYGAYFYAGSPGQLSGRGINRFRIILGSRLGVGAYNNQVTVHFYCHNSANRPGGDVSRVLGPFDVIAAPWQGPTMYDLPVSWASQVISGGGIAIALDPYAGFKGRNEEADSGKLVFDWSM